jgi:hypothetical protein
MLVHDAWTLGALGPDVVDFRAPQMVNSKTVKSGGLRGFCLQCYEACRLVFRYQHCGGTSCLYLKVGPRRVMWWPWSPTWSCHCPVLLKCNILLKNVHTMRERCYIVAVILENLLHNSVACAGMHLFTFQPVTFAIIIGSQNFLLVYH